MNICNYLKGECQEDGSRLCSVVLSDRARADSEKLVHRKLHLIFCCMSALNTPDCALYGNFGAALHGLES